MDFLYNSPPIILSFIAFLGFLILNKISNKLINLQSRKHHLDRSRSTYIKKFFNAIWLTLLAIAFGFAWDVPFKNTFASFFAIAGVALFAQWSILSNITASIILFFYVPYKIGSKVKMIDGENSIKGKIVDITFFMIEIENEEGQIISVPNNLALQKSVIMLSKE